MLNDKMIEIVKLGVDQINKVPVANFSNQTRNQAIRDKFFELMGTDKFDVMSYQKHKYEIFEIIKETLQQTIADGDGVMSSFYNQFVEESFVKLGDSKEFEITNDAYLTVAKISGNNWDLDRQRMDKGATFTVSTSAYYIKIFEYFKRFMTGRMDFAELATKVDISIRKFKDELVAKAFATAIVGLPTGFSYSGGYVDAEIQKVLTNVSASNDGSQITLVGTKGALNKLQGISVTNLSDSQKAEYNSNGFLREWKGYICAELPTLFKANSITEFIFDNTTIYVLPSDAKPVKVVNEGEVLVAETDDVTDNVDMTRDFAIIWRIGAIAIFNRLIGAIKITS